MVKSLSLLEKTECAELVMEERYSTLEYALFRMGAATSASALHACARTLYRVLKEHFALEDDPASFFSNIQELATNCQVQILELRRQHGELLKLTERLADRCEKNEEGAGFRNEARALVSAIRQHEALETKAYFEGLYNDLGGQG